MFKIFRIQLIILFYILLGSLNLAAQKPGKPTSCANSDFSAGDFTNWVGHTSIYPKSVPGTNVTAPYYYNTGIVPGRHTIITTATADPFTCGNVLTLPPGEKQCVRLGNGGIGPWGDGVKHQIDQLDYTFSITTANALLLYKYAIVLQDPAFPHHEKEIRPRFIASVKDQTGKLIDPLCGQKEFFVDSTVAGFRNCPQREAEALGGRVTDNGDIVYRAWTTVGVDLRKYIGQNITIRFETWDCGMGGHFGYAYVTAKCDSLGIIAAACSDDGSVKLTAPDGFAYKWLPRGETTQSISIVGAKAGDIAEVELTTISGCKTNLTTVIYPQKTKANFTINPTKVCLNQPVSFVDSSYSYSTANQKKIAIVDWQWNFGDSTYANTANPTHVYTKAGDKRVVLKITNASGCMDSIVKFVKVLPAPVANFTFKDACENSPVTFTENSISNSGGAIKSGWLWTFGDDNSTSTLQNPTHTFSSSGNFSIKLTVGDEGCTDDTIQTIKIFPAPDAKYIVTKACIGDETVFKDESIQTDNADPIITWVWNFGDGTPYSSNKNPSHFYAKDSTYKSSLLVITARGCIDTVSLGIILHPKPLAKFTATPLCLSTPVQFTDISTPAMEVSDWYWSFNDKGNNHSTIKNPTFKYDTSAIYQPKLVVKSMYGCVDSVTILLDIPPLPQVNFDADKYEGCVPLSIAFTDGSFSSVDKIIKWYWSFGDDNYSYEQHPKYTYTTPGIFTVSLSITTANSCVQTYTWNGMIKAYPIPTAAFSYTPVEPTETNNNVTFQDESSGANFWNWNFGDNGFSDSHFTSHTYTTSGTYVVWQFVKNNHNCVDSIAHPLVIKPSWNFYAPNVFTPNKDGKNDGFIPSGYNITEFQMWIFDRWGDLVYVTEKTKDPASAVPWDGHANNGSQRAQQDVYVWLVKLKDIHGESHSYIGHVSILK